MHDVVARAQRLSTAKVGDARSVLLKQYVYAPGHQCGNQPIVAVQGIGKHHITWAEAIEQAAYQSEFTGALAAVWPDRCIERGTSGQANHHDQSRQWKAHSWCLRAGLGIALLVLWGIGHRYPGAIHQLHRTPTPQPWPQRLLAEQAPCFARERTDHLQWQALARSAVPAGANTARGKAIDRTLRGPAVDRVLARAIGLEHLAHVHR